MDSKTAENTIGLQGQTDVSAASTDSASLTQRAAMIRDELLGNNSVERSTEHGSGSSSGSTEDAVDQSNHGGKSRENEDKLEDRLDCSSIVHALRHIALAFEEKSRELESLRKIQQARDEELLCLQKDLEGKETESKSLIDKLDQSSSAQNTLYRRIECLESEMEHKNELLCFSDRISSRLFEIIHKIGAQVEAAKSLSPAIRSLSATRNLSSERDVASTLSSDVRC